MIGYYKNTLYPLQDKVLQVLQSIESDFYLTGGTALSRFYFHHRYSDDLDFFTHNKKQFMAKVDQVLSSLNKKGLDFKLIQKSSSYAEILVQEVLRVDFVCDTGKHWGDFEQAPQFSKIDNLKNILANKLTALVSRDEVKDVVDIWKIWQETDLDWEEVFLNANSKAVGISPIAVAKKLDSFPPALLSQIKWQQEPPSEDQFTTDLEKLIEEIL